MFGAYIHIPYCLQRCRYCDFATYVQEEIIPQDKYVELLCKEISLRSHLGPGRPLESVYFGGGTPSLLPPESIIAILQQLEKHNFPMGRDTEVTIEINPATLNERAIERLIEHGVNRFSVGAQSFNDRLLKLSGRKHNSKETRDTLDLLKKYDLNYSFDLLFALPTQTAEELDEDLKEVIAYSPPHLSAYCLTVPEGHPMSFQRPSDIQQAKMFEQIEKKLNGIGLNRYEMSNFAKSSMESRHNSLYWTNKDYLGFGLSAHSFLTNWEGSKVRFWNPSSVDGYTNFIQSLLSESTVSSLLEKGLAEVLTKKQSLFDFSHTALRMQSGLSLSELTKEFSAEDALQLQPGLNKLVSSGLLNKKTEDIYSLSHEGFLLSNRVFAQVYDLVEDLP